MLLVRAQAQAEGEGDEVSDSGGNKFEEALLTYGKKSQGFPAHLVNALELTDAMAAVLVVHRRALREAERGMREKAAHFIETHRVSWTNRKPLFRIYECETDKNTTELAKAVRALKGEGEE